MILEKKNLIFRLAEQMEIFFFELVSITFCKITVGFQQIKLSN